MQNRFRTKVCAAVAAGFTSMAFTGGLANAALTLTLSEPGYAPVSVTDTTNSGVISNFAPYGTYNVIDVDVATSNKLQSPTPAEAVLQITSIVESNVSNTLTPLTITVSDNGYTFPGASGANEYMDSSLGGTLAPSSAGDKVTFQSIATANSGVGASNVSAGLQTYLAAGNPVGNGAFDEPDANTTFVRGSSFDLTDQIVVTLNNPYETANLSGTTTASPAPIPEPSTIALFSSALAVLSMRRRNRSAGLNGSRNA